MTDCGVQKFYPQGNELSTDLSTHLLTNFTVVVSNKQLVSYELSTYSTGVKKKII